MTIKWINKKEYQIDPSCDDDIILSGSGDEVMNFGEIKEILREKFSPFSSDEVYFKVGADRKIHIGFKK